MVKSILLEDLGLQVHGDRFFDSTLTYSYPISIVIYDHKHLLGYFDPEFYELGFHKHLMHANATNLKNIVRHELAHYMVFIQGYRGHPHGQHFKDFCRNLGWGQEVYQASMHIETPQVEEENAVLRKVKKLMALATSSHQNEAEQAVIKAQSFLLYHNLSLSSLADTQEESFILKRVLKQKRQDAKLRAIAKILETFFVYVVFHKGREAIHLEILGTEVNVKIAEYVSFFLQEELERLWIITSSLKGKLAKNSFFHGIAKGYCDKINVLQRNHSPAISQNLIQIGNKLNIAKELAYPRLSFSKSHAKYCPKSASLGETAGKALTIHPGLETDKSSLKYLS